MASTAAVPKSASMCGGNMLLESEEKRNKLNFLENIT